MARALINMPGTAPRGQVIDIRTLISHPMESGFRVDAEGKVRPRDIIRRFSCRYNGELVFGAELFPAIAANPYIAFSTVAVASGSLVFTWEGDNGFMQTETLSIEVT
jgi:sulfur-oxidizing protein SoxZ